MHSLLILVSVFFILVAFCFRGSFHLELMVNGPFPVLVTSIKKKTLSYFLIYQ